MNIKMTAEALGISREQVIARMRAAGWLRRRKPWESGDEPVAAFVVEQGLAINYDDGGVLDPIYVLVMNEGLEALRNVAD